MTEQEWLDSEDPAAMLACLNCDTPTGHVGRGRQKIGDRKLRLFACSCWRLYHEAIDPVLINAAEQFADGVITREIALSHIVGRGVGQPHHTLFQPRAGNAAGNAVVNCRRMAAAADILRDIAGNPHRPVTLPEGPKCQVCRGDGAGWTGDNISSPVDWWECDVCGGAGRLPCPWLTPTVLSLAHAAYDERLPDGTLDPARLAVLADALEEASCNNREILDHLRNNAVHVRGCWVLDLVLGKE